MSGKITDEINTNVAISAEEVGQKTAQEQQNQSQTVLSTISQVSAEAEQVGQRIVNGKQGLQMLVEQGNTARVAHGKNAVQTMDQYLDQRAERGLDPDEPEPMQPE